MTAPESVALTVVPDTIVRLGVIEADTPAKLVKQATAVANELAAVIDSRKLYSSINGKRFVRVEGWTTMLAMLGITPHEANVVEQDGTYTATVELRRLSDGAVIGRASAECGTDEKTWAQRDRYARRSMALTRATGKAARLAFSWIMTLAGFEATPAEEVPDESHGKPEPAKDAGPVWPFGDKKGTPLKKLSNEELVAGREWAAKKDAKKFERLIEQVDEELESRRAA